MTVQITGITIDKRLADNIASHNELNFPDESQRIKVTVNVAVGNKPAPGVFVHWDFPDINQGSMHCYDVDEERVDDPVSNPGKTDPEGNAVLYIASANKCIFNIGAWVDDAGNEIPRERSVSEHQQTLVICTFNTDGGTKSSLPAPTIPLEDNGAVNIPDDWIYSTKGHTGTLNGNGKIAIWMYGRINGYADLDNQLSGTLLAVESYQSGENVPFNVPYQWMEAGNSVSQNQLSYLLYASTGTQSDNLVFGAEGTAHAMPDMSITPASGYDKMQYIESDKTSLDVSDLDTYPKGLPFIIPDYPEKNSNDKIIIDVYIDGWVNSGLTPVQKQLHDNYQIKDFPVENGDSIYRIPVSAVKGIGASFGDVQMGSMFIRYQINDDKYLISDISFYHINFAN